MIICYTLFGSFVELNFCVLLIAVATPKQIRELMQVDGLTNDEVKSHLQVSSWNLFFFGPFNCLSFVMIHEAFKEKNHTKL